jgi:cbb3-type cytochrome oxidase subunit 3
MKFFASLVLTFILFIVWLIRRKVRWDFDVSAGLTFLFNDSFEAHINDVWEP